MKMLTIKNTIVALMAVLLSSNAYAMDIEDVQYQSVRVAVTDQETIQQEKDGFAQRIQMSTRNNDLEQFNTALRVAAGKQWFSKKAVDWAFEMAVTYGRVSMLELLFKGEGNAQPSQERVASVFKARAATLDDDVKLLILDHLFQQGTNQEVMNQIDLEDMLPKAAARGKLPLVQQLLNLPQNCLPPTIASQLQSIKSAAAFGQLETFNYFLQHARNHGTFTRDPLNESLISAVVGYGLDTLASPERLRSIRDVINQLLNMNQNGPTQETVDRAFQIAVDSSVGQDDLRLVQIMLLDRVTGKLRTGLRPTNAIITYTQTRDLDESVSAFLKSLTL